MLRNYLFIYFIVIINLINIIIFMVIVVIIRKTITMVLPLHVSIYFLKTVFFLYYICIKHTNLCHICKVSILNFAATASLWARDNF